MRRRDVSFVVVRFGVDDLTLGFDMNGLRSSVDCAEELPGVQTARGKMLGQRTKQGQWAHMFGRSVVFWKPETKRLYVQAKLAADGELCAPPDVAGAVRQVVAQLESRGLASWDRPWVTRVDVAVDGTCDPADGKLLLDALEAARPPNGWRVTTQGTPRSTVYFRASNSEKVKARAYCRNLRTGKGAPFGLIRLEAQHGWSPRKMTLAEVSSPAFLGHLWRSRFGGLAAQVRRVPDDVQALDLGLRMKRGELDHGEFERMNAFLSLERQGVAGECYKPSVYALRRREAVRLGFGANDGKPGLEIELGDLLRSYVRAVDVAVAA
jgi:hypothetical protein